jgi:hypothetical protein
VHATALRIKIRYTEVLISWAHFLKDVSFLSSYCQR